MSARPETRKTIRRRAQRRERTRRAGSITLVAALIAALSIGTVPAAVAAGTPAPEVSGTATPDATPSATPDDTVSPEPEVSEPEVVETPEVEKTPEAEKQAPADETPAPEKSASEGDESTAPTPQKREAAPEVAPFAVGPDGAQPPYVYWETRSAGGDLVGDATYQLQGPRTSSTGWFGSEYNVSWNTTISVTDCTAAPCTGADLDPDPGEFLVKQIGSHSISDTNRYRVRQATPPSGYYFTTSGNPWVEIPGNRNTPSGWSAQRTYDFGDFAVTNSPPYAARCEAGYIYGVTNSGRIRQIDPNGDVSDFGSAASQSNLGFNGLGIGANGSRIFGYERYYGNEAASIWEFDTANGTWSDTGHSIDSNPDGSGGSRQVGFVAGAVNLQTSRYLLGGFSSNGQQFRIWEYNPAAPGTPVYKGYIDTSFGATNSGNNGDMAFNAQGTLFVVRGKGDTTTVFSVTAADLAAGSGGLITSSRSASVQTMSNVNGVAFDSSGRAFLGAGDEMRSYAMPNWSNGQDVTDDLNGSTDLASCSSPATIELEKYIDGARVNSSDQFTLTLSQGNQELGTATTAGSAVGVQQQRVGPLPTARGVTLTFSETAASGSLANYASSWNCSVDGEPMTSGAGTSGSVTIPAIGDEIVCRISNAPLIANVTVHKDVTDFDGESPEPREGWTVGATATATAGSVTMTPAGTQPTNAQGAASWTARFTTAESRATVNVSEVMQPGYEFLEGQCAVTKLDGTTALTEITGIAAPALTGVAPGDSVECFFVNRPATGAIEVTKTDATSGDELAGAVFQLWNDVDENGIRDPAVDTTVGAPVTTPGSGIAEWTGLEWGFYLVEEVTPPANYELAENPVQAFEVTATELTLESIFANPRKTGTVIWSKIAAGDGGLLEGSEWTIVGPGTPESGVVVVDCVTTCEAGAFKDQDPEAGQFELAGLAWGSYTLTESAAPLGYLIDTTTYTFVIGPDGDEIVLDRDLGDIENEQVPAVVLPLTGGTASDLFLIVGGALLALMISLGVVHTWRRGRKAAA